MSFDLDAALRWLKPRKRRHSIQRRPDSALTWVEHAPLAGGPVLLDTTVYVDVLQGRSPPYLDRFIEIRICNHSAVCISELVHSFGRLQPSDSRTASALRAIGQVVRSVPAHRISAPDSMTWGSAGILAGMLFRLGAFPPGAERKCLNDALVFVQARKLGCAVLTRNIRDFDCLNQLVPDVRVLFYRTTE